MKPRMYIAGAGGMLGQAFYHVFKDSYELQCSDIIPNEDWLSHLDFRLFGDYANKVGTFYPDILVHLGAYTDLEFCENHKTEAFLTNTIAVEHAVTIANDLDIPIVYISTAGIFDGKKEQFDDYDTPNPLCVYARSKYAGELIVQQRAKQYYIFRAGWMMGGGVHKDIKFVGKIMHQIRAGAKVLNIVDDKLGTPTYTFDFARNAKLVIEHEEFGLYNMVCKGMTSRLEVAKEMLKILKREEIQINEVTSEHFSKEYFAPRPDNERLVNMKLDIKGLNIMRPWQMGLSEYLEKYDTRI
jgi:dTDP-4-dehydrorhamnose reductase